MFKRGKAKTKELEGDGYNYASSQTHLEFSLDAKFNLSEKIGSFMSFSLKMKHFLQQFLGEIFLQQLLSF